MQRQGYAVIKNDPTNRLSDGQPLELRRCGHRHRSLRAAERCLKNLISYDPRAKTWSAAWHLAEIRRYDNTPLDADEGAELGDIRSEAWA